MDLCKVMSRRGNEMGFIGMPHRKQFVIGAGISGKMHQLPERFKYEDLGGGIEIAYCPDLTIYIDKTSNGGNVLIGDVVESDAAKSLPEAVLSHIDLTNVSALTKTWTGHWLLVLDGQLLGDCCGLFSLYFPREILLQKAGFVAASNSPELISRIYGIKHVSNVRKMQRFAMAPWSFLPEFRTLLATEMLNLKTGLRQDLDFPVFEFYDVDLQEIRVRVAGMLTTAVRRIYEKKQQKLLCALSAGYDSRLNLAAAYASGVDFSAYTFVKPYFYISEGDRLLPPKIAGKVNVAHKHIRASDVVNSDALATAYLEHAGNFTTTYPGSGYDHYVHNYWAQAGLGATVLDGQCYELAVNYHRKKFAPDYGLDDLHKFGFAITDTDFEEVERQWECQADLGTRMDRRDLLFWTANINGVYAKMTQEHDLFVDLFYPACNREQFNLLLSVPIELREDCLFQASITQHLAPALAEIPYNPAEPFHKRGLKRVRNDLMRILKL